MEERKEILQRLTSPNKIEQYVEQVFEDIQKKKVPPQQRSPAMVTKV